jgi:hypothetical protein
MAKFKFYYLAVASNSSASAQAVSCTWSAAGSWRAEQKRNTDKRGTAIVRFANMKCGVSEVLRFLKDYGPVVVNRRAEHATRFTLKDWERWQAEFREIWNGPALKDWSLPFADGDELACVHGVPALRLPDLWRYLVVNLHAAGLHRTKCLNPDCPAPFFVARHLKEKYCTPECVLWAKRRDRLEWWNREGSKRRQTARRNQRRGGRK